MTSTAGAPVDGACRAASSAVANSLADWKRSPGGLDIAFMITSLSAAGHPGHHLVRRLGVLAAVRDQQVGEPR